MPTEPCHHAAVCDGGIALTDVRHNRISDIFFAHPLLYYLCPKERAHALSASDLIVPDIAVQLFESIVGDVVVKLLFDILDGDNAPFPV